MKGMKSCFIRELEREMKGGREREQGLIQCALVCIAWYIRPREEKGR